MTSPTPAGRVAAVVPAAGASRRMGRPKLLIEVEGRPLISRVVATLRKAGVDPVIVVPPPVGVPEGPPLIEAASKAGAVVVTPDVRPAEMRESFEMGLAELARSAQPPAGILLTPADSPRLEASLVEKLLQVWRGRPHRIAVPTFEGRRGHPIVLPWLLARAVGDLPAGVGVNALLGEHAAEVEEVPCATNAVLVDLDTPEDLSRLHRMRTVRLFAIARQLAEASEVVVELPDSATVADLRRVLVRQHPALAGIAERVRIAVGDEYAGDDAVIPADAPLALIPPVSGGGC